jgi:hypothetical protein
MFLLYHIRAKTLIISKFYATVFLERRGAYYGFSENEMAYMAHGYASYRFKI